MTELLLRAILCAQTLDPEDQDRIADIVLAKLELPVIEA
jgi:hypothetical protein